MPLALPAPNKTDIDILLEIDGRKIFYECKTTADALFGSPSTRDALVKKLTKQMTKDPDAEFVSCSRTQAWEMRKRLQQGNGAH